MKYSVKRFSKGKTVKRAKRDLYVKWPFRGINIAFLLYTVYIAKFYSIEKNQKTNKQTKTKKPKNEKQQKQRQNKAKQKKEK